MQYYSTNKQAPDVTLEEAVVKGLAADKGLFMPFTIKPLPQEFYDSIDTLGFQEIAYRVADAFFGEDVPASDSSSRATSSLEESAKAAVVNIKSFFEP